MPLWQAPKRQLLLTQALRTAPCFRPCMLPGSAITTMAPLLKRKNKHQKELNSL
jgi:hypothetical protein